MIVKKIYIEKIIKCYWNLIEQEFEILEINTYILLRFCFDEEFNGIQIKLKITKKLWLCFH